MSRLEAYLSDIEACADIDALKARLQIIAEDFGFQSFNFLDVGSPHIDIPFYMGTTGEAWESDYKGNGFVHVDHCVTRARRTNVPFAWDEVALPPIGPRSGTFKLMDAAADYGFKNGFVVPFHHRDQLARYYSSLCVFYWKDRMSRFKSMMSRDRHELHIIVIYWVQRAIDLVAKAHRAEQRARLGFRALPPCDIHLTDRERDALSWAAQGKTAAETSAILSVSEVTVTAHLKSAIKKLAASNKTHAAMRALQLGLIDI